MFPISLGVYLLKTSGWLDPLSVFLEPLMRLVGLPGSMAIVWFSTILTGLYGGIISLASVGTPLSQAQVTVLGILMLMAHSLPVEVRLTQMAGLSALYMLLLRFLGALLFGGILHLLLSYTGWLSGPAYSFWHGEPVASWSAWLTQELWTYLKIFGVIFGLLAFIKFLHRFHLDTLFNTLLAPVLKPLNLSPAISPAMTVGLLLGLSYGGGLILKDAQSGQLSRRDILVGLSFIALCHCLIEDTLLTLSIGGHIGALLWGRIIFSYMVVWTLSKTLNYIPHEKSLRSRYASE